MSIFAPLLALAAMTPSPVITCETGIIPLVQYRAVLDTSNNHISFVAYKEGIVANGTAVYTTLDDHKYYHMQYTFNAGVQIFFDGTEWWLCQEETECLRCGQQLRAQP